MKRDTISNIYRFVIQQLKKYADPPTFAPYETIYVRFMVAFLVCWTYRDCPLDQPHLRGISKYVDLQWTCTGGMFILNQYLMWLCCILYTLRVYPVLTSNYLSFMFIATNSTYNSYAIFHGNQILSQILLIRGLAHIYYAAIRILAKIWPEKFIAHSDHISEDEEESRLVRLGQEVMAGAYFTSVITKLQQSNWQWLFNSHYFIISAMVTRERAHLWGELPSGAKSLPLQMLEDLLTVHTLFPKIMFSGGFFTELLAPVFLHSKPTLLFGGIMIFQMHYWIQWIMQLTFGINMFLATAFFVDVPYWCHKLLSETKYARYFEPLQRFPSLFGTKTDFVRKNKDKKNYEEIELSEVGTQNKKKSTLSWGTYLWRAFKRCPFKLMVVLIILSLYLQESFPFSHWPMYANPISQATYMQIQDKNGDPIMPTKDYIVPSLSQVNKHFKSICKEFFGKNWDGNLKKELKCGNSTLYSVISFTKKRKEDIEPKLPLRLVKTIIRMDDQNKISRETRIVGYLEKLPPLVPRKNRLTVGE